MPSANNTASFGKLFQTSVLTNSILEKVLVIAEANQASIVKIEENLANTASSMSRVEELLSVQNKILLQIAENQGGGGGVKDPGFSIKDLPAFGIKAAGAALATIVGLAAAITISAKLFSLIDASDPIGMLIKFGVALATVGVLYLMAEPFTELIRVLGSLKSETSGSIDGAEISTSSGDIMGMAGAMGGAVVAIVGMTASIVIATHIMRLAYGGFDILPKLAIVALTSLALIPVAYGFTMVMEVLGSMKSSVSAGAEGMGGSKSGADIGGMAGSIGGAFISIILMSLAIAISTQIISKYVDVPDAPEEMYRKLLIVGLTGLALVPVAIAFGFVVKALAPIGSNPLAIIGALLGATAALPLMAFGISLAIYVLEKTLPKTWPNLPDFVWIGKLALMLIIGAGMFYVISKVIKEMSLEDIGKTGLAMAVIGAAMALSIKAWTFINPPSDPAPLPPMSFLGPFLLTILVGSLAFYFIGQTVKGMRLMDLLMVVGGMAAIAAGLAGAIWAWNKFAPDAADYKPTPPPDYIMGFGLMLLIGSGIAYILGRVGFQGIILGTLGIPLLIFAIASALRLWSWVAPDNAVEMARQISESALQPIYAVINAIAYFRKKIPTFMDALGIAGSLIVIAGAWAIFSATLAGMKIVGSIANAIGGVFDFLTEKLTGEKPESTVDILIKLANNSTAIIAMAQPLMTVAVAFGKIAIVSQPAIDKVSGFLEDLHEYEFTDQANDLTKIAAAYRSLAQSSGMINIAGFNATTEMFQALESLAGKGGSDAIDSLKELLVDTLEALADAVHKMTTQNTTVTEALGNTIEAVTDAVGLTNSKDKDGGDKKPPIQKSNDQLLAAINTLKKRLDGTLYVEVQNKNFGR